MKYALTLSFAALALSGCVTSTEFDRDRAYSKCESISDKSSRDRCIADAIAQSERERSREDAKDQQRQDDADRRELGREIAGVKD